MTRRSWALLAATAAVLAAAVGPPANETPAEAAHEDNRSGHVWVPASVTAGATTWEWEHVNLWECEQRVCDPSTTVTDVTAGVRDEKQVSDCQNRGATAAAAGGCGGHSAGGGWEFRGHVMCYVGGSTPAHAVPSSPRAGTSMPTGCSGQTRVTGSRIEETAQYPCPAAGGPVSSSEACGTWTECTGNTVPNGANTSCVPCGAREQPTADGEDCELTGCDPGKHRHGDGECADNHDYTSVGPDCDPDLTTDTTIEWTYHNSAGTDVTVSKVCVPSGGGRAGQRQVCNQWSLRDGETVCTRWIAAPPPPDNTCDDRHRASTGRRGKIWTFQHAIREASGPTRHRYTDINGYTAYRTTYSSPHPLTRSVGPRHWLWTPRTIPNTAVDAPVGEAAWVEHSTGGAWRTPTSASPPGDLPEDWYLGGVWRPGGFEADGTIVCDNLDDDRKVRLAFGRTFNGMFLAVADGDARAPRPSLAGGQGVSILDRWRTK